MQQLLAAFRLIFDCRNRETEIDEKNILLYDSFKSL